MTPTTRTDRDHDHSPIEQLQSNGWVIASSCGAYCVAWRESEEVVFSWQSGRWQAISGRAVGRAA